MRIGSGTGSAGIRRLGVSCTAGALLMVAGNLTAQERLAIEEITVTARKVEESLQEVPIAVSPFTAKKIQELNLRSTDDLALFTPGLSFTSAFGRQPGSDRPAVRGISTIQNGVGNSSAMAYFIDGVYLGGSPQSTELFNLERVEVLKGPQAAQFGRGTYLGAINYVTKRPGEELGGELEVSAGEDGYVQGLASFSGPISDTVGFYVGVGFDTFDGQYTNQRDGGDLGGEESTSITGKLHFNPSDTLEIIAKLGYQETDDDHFAVYLQPRELNNCCFRGDPGSGIAPRAREYYVGEAVADENNIELFTDLLDRAGGAGAELERFIAALTINWEFLPDITLTSLTGYVDDEIQTGFDVSYAAYEPFPFPTFLNGAFNQFDRDEQSDFSQELRVTSNAVQNIRLTLGGYLYDGDTEELESLGVTTAGDVVQNPFVSSNTLEEIENWAVFGGADWDINEQITVGLELRYAEDEITVFETALDGSGPVVGGSGCTKQTCNDTFDSFTPRITAVYRIRDGINIYGNIAKGTKPGDFNSQVPTDVNGNPDESLRAVDEEEAWNYELGLKSELWEGRANMNIAGYFLDVTDQQLTQVIELQGGLTTSILQNVGETEVWGIELDATVLVTENLTAGLTYAWTDAEITKRISTDEADLQGLTDVTDLDQLAALGDVSGRDVPRVPENQFSLFARYEQPFGGGGDDNRWFISADWAYEDSKWAQEHNLIETGDRNIVGLQAGVIWGNWEFKVWGKNIFDDDTPVDILRYIDRRSGTLPSCNSVLGAAPGPAIPACAGQSTSPRGFGLTLPRQSQWGATLNFRFGG
jgi:outer membrane receptor protein involved in Fe transport